MKLLRGSAKIRGMTLECARSRILPVEWVDYVSTRWRVRIKGTHEEKTRALDEYFVRLHIFECAEESDDVKSRYVHWVAWRATDIDYKRNFWSMDGPKRNNNDNSAYFPTVGPNAPHHGPTQRQHMSSSSLLQGRHTR